MGDLLPHFAVEDVHGTRIDYGATLWQRKFAVVIACPSGDVSDDYRRIANDDVAVIVTREPIAGLPSCGITIADKWGEIARTWTASAAADLPPPAEIAEWVQHVRMRCPECEGETR